MLNSMNFSDKSGATVYIASWGNENSILADNTTINQYVEITFTVSGLE